VIVAGARAVQAAKAATSTIPIVFQTGGDPVRQGLVDAINRPSGNVTGVSLLASEVTAKRFGLLHQALPNAGTIGVLRDTNTRDFVVQEAEAAARSVGVPIRVIACTESEVETAFATFSRENIGALFVANSFLFFGSRQRLAELEARYRIPASYELRDHVDVGGFMSYGPSASDTYRQVGIYAARILKGEKPGDLPVMLPARFEFVLNLKAVRALGARPHHSARRARHCR